jgi:glycosyltransferase involved in cell wall biosynthesis
VTSQTMPALTRPVDRPLAAELGRFHANGGSRRLRVGFVMELVLGHVTWYQNLRYGVSALDAVDARWVETTLYDPRGLLERTPGVPGVVRAGVRAWLDVHRGLRGWPADVLLFNTHKAAMLCQLDMLRTPTILLTDVTPRQYDEMAVLYDHAVDGSCLVRELKHRANVLNFRLADALVVSSRWTRDSFVRDYGVPNERVHVIPIGADLDFWRPVTNRPPNERVKLLFVGGHFERKGGRLLLDVFRALGLDRWAELHVVTRDEVKPADGVFVHRAQNNSPELLRLYQEADAFVLPTLADCFGNASIEAMGMGLPVITTDMGGIPDIVEHGRTGFLLPPGDGRGLAQALFNVINDPERRATMSVASRARALERFDARKNAAEILTLAQRVYERRRAGVGRSSANSGR